MVMMISKFHRLIQSKLVWGIFALVISVSFVLISIPGAGNRKASRNAQKEAQLAGRLFGEDVSRNEFGRAYQNVFMTYTMMIGRAIQITPEIDQVFRTAAWQRIAILKKARQLGMTATPAQTIEMIQSQPVFQNQETGQFDKTIYDTFITGFLPNMGMNAQMFEHMFSEQVLIEKVSAIPAQGGLVSEAEIKKAFHFYTDMLTVEYAAIPRSLTSPREVTDEDAKHYFELNQEGFRMPEKVIVDYVKFAVADYADDVEVPDEMVAGFYENNKQRYIKQAEAATDPATEIEFNPLEDVRGEIVELITQELARRAAADQADELVSELADESMTLEMAAETLGLTIVNNTPAFTLTDSVKDIDPTSPFQRAAFALEQNETHYYSDPVVGRDFIYVISLTKKLPSFLPSFEVVRDAALESAKIAASEKAYVEKANQIHGEIKAALQTGSTFSDATAQYELELKTTEPFNITSTLSDAFGQEIKTAALLYGQGKVTDLVSTADEYLVAYVAEKIPGDEAAALPSMRDVLVSNISSEKSARLVASWREDLLKEADFMNLLIRTDDDES